MFRTSGASASSFASKISGAFVGVAKASALLVGAAGIGGLAVILRTGSAEWAENAQVAAQTAQVLKTTGGVANVTQRQVETLAGSIMKKTGIDDEQIQSTENMLLGFTNLHNELGRGNNIFTRATQAVVDYSARTGKDSTKAAIAFGRALNDPAKGMSALTRYGIQFTDAQKKQVVALEKSGKTLEAQKMVLDAVEKRYKGAAEAAGRTLPGQLNVLKETFKNFAGNVVGSLAPLATKGLSLVNNFFNKFTGAKGFEAKINVVWGAIKDTGGTLTSKISSAVAAVDWSAAWNRATGIAEGLKARFESIDWAPIGASIGDGIAAGVGKTAAVGQKLAGSLMEAFRSIDWNQLGRAAGPGLAAALVAAFATLTDPAFWMKNWDLALAVALVAFSGAIGKVVGRVAEVFARPLARVFETAVLGFASTVERLSPRIGEALLNALMKLPGLVASQLGKLEGIVAGAFGRLGRVAQFVVKVLGIDAAIRAVAQFAQDVWEKLKHVASQAYKAAVSIGTSIVSGVASGIYGSAEGAIKAAATWMADLVPSWMKKLLFIGSPSRRMADEVGRPIAEGVIQGWIEGSAALPAKLSEKLRDAIDKARQTIENSRSAFTTAFGTLASTVSQAFQAITAAQKTPTEKLLDKLVSQHDAAQFKQNLADARASLQGAKADIAAYLATAGGTPEQLQKVADATTKVALAQDDLNAKIAKYGEGSAQAQKTALALHSAQAALSSAEDAVGVDPSELAQKRQAVVDAQRQVNDLLYQQNFAALQKRADSERVQLDAQNAVRQIHLDNALQALQAHLAKSGASVGESTQAILKLLASYGVNFKDVGRDMGIAWIAGLKEMIEKAAKGAGALSSTIANAAAGITIPTKGKASGGPVFAGMPYMVGERGRELFVPSTNGRIIPNGALAGSGGGVVFQAGAIVVNGFVGDELQLARVIKDAIHKDTRLGGSQL